MFSAPANQPPRSNLIPRADSDAGTSGLLPRPRAESARLTLRDPGGYNAAAGPALADLMKPLRRRWLLVLCLGLLAAGAAAGVAWYAIPASHTAFALLRVAAVEPRMVFPSAENKSDYATYQKTQISLIKSPLVLNAALRQPQIADLKCIREQVDPITWLAKELIVDYTGGSEVLRISLTGDQPNELAKVVNAVKDAYLQEVVTAESNLRRARIRELEQIHTENEEKVRSKRNMLRQLARTLGTSDSQALTLKQQIALQHFAELRKEHTRVQFELMRARVEAVAQKARANAQAEVKVPQTLIDDSVNSDPQIQQLLVRLGQLQRVITRYESIVVNKNEPRLVEYRDELKTIQQKFDARKGEIVPALTKRLQEKVQGDSEATGARVKDQIALLTDQEKLLREEVDRYAKEVDKIGNSSADLELMRAEIEQVDAITKRVGSEKQALEVESRNRPRVTLVEEASVPQAAELKKKIAMTALAGALAFAAVGFGIARREHYAARIDTPDDVTAGLGLRVVGALPATGIKRNRRTKALAAPDASHPLGRESIDGIRALLLHDARTEATRVIMVTSALENEGKTTVASHLAGSLARADRATLLIDGDLRRPSAHRMFDLPANPGLSEVLRGELDIFDAIRPTAIPGLSLLTVGEIDPKIMAALARDDLQTFFDAIKMKFDFIIIDSSPVLKVADALLIGKHADAVLLAIRRDISRMPAVQAARERLEMVGIRVLGAVMTDVKQDRFAAASPAYQEERAEPAPTAK